MLYLIQVKREKNHGMQWNGGHSGTMKLKLEQGTGTGQLRGAPRCIEYKA